MAVRFDATGEEYTSTDSPPTGDFTVACWICVAVDRNTYSTFWESSASTAHYLQFATAADGQTLSYYQTGATTLAGPLMAVGEWYRTAIVRNTAAATNTLYSAAAGASTLASTSTAIDTAVPSTLRIGGSIYTAEWANGLVANFKHFSAALTQAEIEAELAQYLPRRMANVVRRHPMVNPETTDHSGNGRTLTGGTGATRGDGPPIPWSGSRPTLILPPVSVAPVVANPPTLVRRVAPARR